MTPITPSAPERTLRLAGEHLGLAAKRRLQDAPRALELRARRLRRLREAGDLATAERYGWLSLAAVLVGLPGARIGRLNPVAAALDERAGADDLLPVPLLPAAAPQPRPIAGTSLSAADPTDAAAFAIATLAARAMAVGAVEAGGRVLAAEGFRLGLRARLERSLHDG